MSTRKIKAVALKPIPARPLVAPAGAVSTPPGSVGKILRGKFTIPESEYLAIDLLKERSARLSAPARKSEIVRAGLKALSAMSDRSLARVLGSVPKLKPVKTLKT